MDAVPRTSDNPQPPIANARLTALLHAGFVLTGIVNTMLGPLLPVLSARWGLNDARTGYLFTAQFSGSMLGVAGSSFLMSRRGSRASLLLGMGLMALGSATLLAPSWLLGMLFTLCFGVGFGLVTPTTNLLVSELNFEKRAAALNLINFSWGVGAATCPLFVVIALRMHGISYLLYGLAGAIALVALGVSGVALPVFSASPDRNSPTEMNPWRSRWLPILAALFFLYVGSEAGVSGWTATYAERAATGSETLWVVMPSFFWAALLVGRASAPLLLRGVRELKLAQCGLVLSTLGLVTMLATGKLSLIAIGVGVAGLGFSSVYPIAIATLSSKFGAAAVRVSGITFALAGAGGATLPWLVGFISSRFGSLKYGLMVPLFGCVVMLFLNVLLSQRDS